MKWTDLLWFYEKVSYQRFCVFQLTCIGFVVSLKIKLIGSSTPLAGLIDMGALLFSVFLLLGSLAIWILNQFIIHLALPPDMLGHSSPQAFFDAQKSMTGSTSIYEGQFADLSEQWSKADSEQRVTMRVLAASLIALSFVLFLISQFVLLLSCWPALQALADRIGSLL